MAASGSNSQSQQSGQPRGEHWKNVHIEGLLNDGYNEGLPLSVSSESDEALQTSAAKPDAEPASPSAKGKKFQPSNWKRENAFEIDLAGSLNQLTAQDLTIHLFNAHKLKQQGLARRQLEQDHSADTLPDDPFTFIWIPPKIWTAWPLPPNIVPRDHEYEPVGVAGDLPHPYLPRIINHSQALREMLLAELLRHAKAKLDGRQTENVEILSEQRDESPPEPIRRYSSERYAGGSSDSDDVVPLGTKKGRQQRKPKRRRRRQPTSEDDASESPDVMSMKPVMLADDEKAMVLLGPAINNITGKLDRLLIALHTSRQSYSNFKPDSPDHTETEGESSSRPQSVKFKRGGSSRRQREAPAADNLIATEDDTNSEERSRKRRRLSSHGERFMQRKRKLNLRDWSEILGMAALSGFDPAVVQRAATRCGDLLGEHMSFRTLHLETTTQEQHDRTPGESVTESEGYSSGLMSNSNRTMGSVDEVVGGVHIDGYMQPIRGRRSWKTHDRKYAGKK